MRRGCWYAFAIAFQPCWWAEGWERRARWKREVSRAGLPSGRGRGPSRRDPARSPTLSARGPRGPGLRPGAAARPRAARTYGAHHGQRLDRAAPAAILARKDNGNHPRWALSSYHPYDLARLLADLPPEQQIARCRLCRRAVPDEMFRLSGGGGQLASPPHAARGASDGCFPAWSRTSGPISCRPFQRRRARGAAARPCRRRTRGHHASLPLLRKRRAGSVMTSAYAALAPHLTAELAIAASPRGAGPRRRSTTPMRSRGSRVDRRGPRAISCWRRRGRRVAEIMKREVVKVSADARGPRRCG